jgi:NADH-quinone oxidoreductase subunit L
VVGGWVGIPAALSGANHIHQFLAPVLDPGGGHGAVHAAAEDAGLGGIGASLAWASESTDHSESEAEHAPAVKHGTEVEHAAGAAEHHHDPAEYVLMFLSVLYALAGIAFAYLLYLWKPEIPKAIGARFKQLYDLLYNKYYVDEIYQAVFIDTTVGLANWFRDFWDGIIIEGLVNGAGHLVRALGGGLRQLQTGKVQGYALTILFGAVIVTAYYALTAVF